MTITRLKQSHLEKISLPNLQVSTSQHSDRPQQQQVCSLAVFHQVGHDEFAQLEKIFDGESQPTFEYFADSQEVVVLSPPSPIHQHLQSGMERWLEDVGEELRKVQIRLRLNVVSQTRRLGGYSTGWTRPIFSATNTMLLCFCSLFFFFFVFKDFFLLYSYCGRTKTAPCPQW